MSADAALMLDTAALGYAASVQTGSSDDVLDHIDQWKAARAHLKHSAIDYASSVGTPDAGVYAELLALRAFRDAIIGLSGELTGGQADTGEHVPDASVRSFVVESIEAIASLWSVK